MFCLYKNTQNGPGAHPVDNSGSITNRNVAGASKSPVTSVLCKIRMIGDVPLRPLYVPWPSQGQTCIYLYFLYRTETWNKARWNESKKWKEGNTRSRTRQKWKTEGPVTKLMEDTVALRQFFSPNTSVFPCQYHSTIAPYPFLHLHVDFPGQTGEAWGPSKKHCSFRYGAVLDSKVPATFRSVCTCVDQAQRVASR